MKQKLIGRIGQIGRIGMLALPLLLGGCVGFANVVGRDLEEAAKLADKFNDPQAAQCYKFLDNGLKYQAAIADSASAGLISSIEKARLLRLYVDQNRDKFESNCGPLVADALLQAGKGLPGVR